MDPITALVIVWMLLPFFLGYLLIRASKRATQAERASERFAPILDVEGVVKKKKRDLFEVEQKISDARASYADKLGHLRRVEQQVAIYDETLAFGEMGMYAPHFDFGDTAKYKDAIKANRDRQKAMIKDKDATVCPNDWTVDGSRAKGRTMLDRQARLTLRAFNSECDAAISNTRWNNANAMERRIENAAKQIDKANASMNLALRPRYISAKLEELRLTHEYREQQKIEKEERAELARAEREEKKLLAEAAAAEKEEKKYEDMLDRARREAGTDEGRIAELEALLAEAHAISEKAKAMAEMTKCGYVYIISNVGSFGEDVVKIGLTRRLDPDDRVKELGDASVPFGFDTHAMIYSDEAPELENALHQEFADRRINMANIRKEFFRVDLDEVESAVGRLAPDAQFFSDREAQEWYETLSKRKEKLTNMQRASDLLPASI